MVWEEGQRSPWVRTPMAAKYTVLSTRVETGPGPTKPPVKWVPGLFHGIQRPGRDVGQPPNTVQGRG